MRCQSKGEAREKSKKQASVFARRPVMERILPDYGLATVSASGATCAVSGSDSMTCVVSDSVVPCPSEAEFSVLGVHEANTRVKHKAAKIVFIVFFMSYRFKISLNSKNSGRSPTQDVFSFGLPSPDICIKPTLLSGVLL